MTTLALERREKFGIGRVLGNSFAVIGRNLGLLIGLAALFSALPAFVLNLLNYRSIDGIEYDDDVIDPMLNTPWIAVVFGLIYFVLALLFQSALVRATIEDLNGKRPALGDCVRTALRSILRTLGVALVVFFAMVLALVAASLAGVAVPVYGAAIVFLALLIPGAMWLLSVSVSVPVLIQERLGVFGSISRSRALTKGSRWSILGLLLILFVAAMALQFVFGLALGLAFAFTGKLSTPGLIASSIGGTVVSTAVSTLISVAIAVSYVELRRVREGTSVDELAEIFS